MHDKAKRTPLQIFKATTVNINPKHWKPFGCPVVVLAEKLANGNPFNKCNPKANIAIYLGRSPIHTKNIAFFR